MKRIFALVFVALASFTLASCGPTTQEGLKAVTKFTAKEMGTWTGSITPDETAFGTATYNEEGDFTVISVGEESWGGVQSPTVTLDLTKQAYFALQVKEVQDAYKWTVKFIPTDPVDGHEWGLYVVEDNGMKWNKYTMVDLNLQFGEDIIDLYGGKLEGVFWIWAVGAADAHVEVLELVVFEGTF